MEETESMPSLDLVASKHCATPGIWWGGQSNKFGAGDVAQRAGGALGLIPALHKPGLALQDCNSNTQEVQQENQ